MHQFHLFRSLGSRTTTYFFINMQQDPEVCLVGSGRVSIENSYHTFVV